MILKKMIAEVKNVGLKPKSYLKYRKKNQVFFGLDLTILHYFKIGGTANRSNMFDLDPSRIKNPVRLENLIKFLIYKNQFSSFVGKPLEWEALNKTTQNVLFKNKKMESNKFLNSNALLNFKNTELSKLVSDHFQKVLKNSLNKTIYMLQNWKVSDKAGAKVFSHKSVLESEINIDQQVVSGLLLEFVIEDETVVEKVKSKTIDAWLLAKVEDKEIREIGKRNYLCLKFKSTALIKDENNA